MLKIRGMKFLCSPKDDIELGFIRSIFESENISYMIQNKHFGQLYTGIQIEAFNQKRIYVDEGDNEKAVELLKEFRTNDSTDTGDSKITCLDKIRFFTEFILFGRIIPKRRRKIKDLKDSEKE